MKKHILLTLLLSLPLLYSCSDEIPYGERYEELPSVDVKRSILLEDFTGQFCSNCPDAHQVISDLQELYGDHVIAVAIHAGHFGIAEDSNPNFVGLMQPEGNTYATHWGVEAYPAGIINRTSGLLKHTEWAAYARQTLVEEAMIDIQLDCKITADSTMIYINTMISSNMEEMKGNKLQLWVTESNINAVQQHGGTLNLNYLHNHVYRASVNGLWGEEANIPYSNMHYIPLHENWDIENLSVVAFVYNDTDGVLNVTEQSNIPIQTFNTQQQ